MTDKTHQHRFSIGDFLLSRLLDYVDDSLWSDNLDGKVKDWDDFEDGTKVVVFNCNPGTCMSVDDWRDFWFDFPEWCVGAYALGVNDYPWTANLSPQQAYDIWNDPEFDEYRLNGTHRLEFGTKKGKYPWF